MSEPERFGAALEPELGRRLAHVYRLPGPPGTLGELRAMFRARRAEDPRVERYLERVSSGEAVIGGSSGETPYANVLAEGEVAVMCAYDAVMNALLRGGGGVRGRCVHCGEALELTVEGGQISALSAPDAVFWLGTGPVGAPGNPVCDHLHLFPDRSHLEGWLETNPEELGVAMPVAEAIGFFTDHPIPPAFARSGRPPAQGLDSPV